LHKLWFVLYKERNLLLTEKEKARRGERPVATPIEGRYIKTKRSMAAIKHCLSERKVIREKLIASGAITEIGLAGEKKPGYKKPPKISKRNVPRTYWSNWATYADRSGQKKEV